MSKNVVVLADGTWNASGKGRDTNVVKLYSVILRNSLHQIAYYDAGVGTGGKGLVRRGVIRLFGGAFGWGLSKNIRDCYQYLVENCQEDDRVYLFGFSRGAYTVRSLGGLLAKCGLLRPEHADKVREAYELYRQRWGPATAAAFKERYSRECHVHVIGVWDTVGALGIPAGLGLRTLRRGVGKLFHDFHDTALSPSIPFGLHALALDEERKTFRPTLWEEPGAPGQVIRQVWFPGVHSDVGGGYPEHDLSDLALEWMINEAQAQGLLMAQDWRSNVMRSLQPRGQTPYEFQPNPLGEMHDSRRGLGKIYRRARRRVTLGQMHPSVCDRMRAMADYRPSNLRPGDCPDVER